MDIRVTPSQYLGRPHPTLPRHGPREARRVIYGTKKKPHFNGKVADKLRAQLSNLTSNPVPETKGRNISQSHFLQNFSQHNANKKIWTNEDRYRKDPRNQIIISTETNPRRTWQSDDTYHIQSVTHLKETFPTSCQTFQDWFPDFSQQQM